MVSPSAANTASLMKSAYACKDSARAKSEKSKEPKIKD
jgi:hypothetical protein